MPRAHEGSAAANWHGGRSAIKDVTCEDNLPAPAVLNAYLRNACRYDPVVRNMNHQIRAMETADIPQAVELLAASSAHDIRPVLRARLAADATPAPQLAIVSGHAGVVSGVAYIAEDPVFPGTVTTLVAVSPDARGKGVGSALAAQVEDELGRLTGATATCMIRDDLPHGKAFAERYGFTVAHHSLGFRYVFTDADTEQLLASRAAEAAARAGVQVRTADMALDEELITECFTRCRIGLPLPFGNRPVDVRERLREFPRNTVYLLARSIEEDRCMGMSILIPEDRSWYVRFTGTDPDFRGRGVAVAVKRASLLHAHQARTESVITNNDDSNIAIIRTNQSLGMVSHVGYWSFTRILA
ncbi:GNAT family N-acetyltransferase [Streptomyces sp. NPDC003328]|uniref:GNAT family N-acetyltransferase n=1 Tax=Streptomyces sp. NRRL F-5122 TaxID=1609098 RepID=UPI00099E8AB8|nr:GNAT family N-acetyltransferase [Streptomyces sp. NRRL F-5122]